MVGEVKESFGDLTKEIEKLNEKIGEVDGFVESLKAKLPNADLEVEGRIKDEITDPLQNINDQVNSTVDNPENIDQSLIQLRKKLLNDINDLVQNLNDNNRALKEASRGGNKAAMKKHREKNEDLIKGAQAIKDRTNEGIERAKELMAELEKLFKEIMPKVEDDMDKKYKMVAKADEIFEKLMNAIDAELEKTDAQLQDIGDLIASLQEQIANETDPEALKELQAQLDKAKAMQDKLKKKKAELEADKAAIQEAMKDLDSLDKKEVGNEQVADILKKLEEMDGKYKKKGLLDGDELQAELEKLKEDAEALLDSSKSKKVDEAKAAVKTL